MTPCRQGKSAISIITAPSSRKYAPGGASDGKLPYSVSLTGGAAERDFGARIGPWWSFKEFWDRLSTLPARGSVVPFKFHSKGRRHIPRQRHRVTNWRDYDSASQSWKPHDLVHRRSVGWLEGATPNHAGRPAALFRSRQRDGSDIASGVS